MVTEAVQTAIFWFEFVTGILLVLLALRIAYILGINPVGEVAQEVLYLRVGDLKVPGLFLFFALLLEIVEFLQPLLSARGLLPFGAGLSFYLNAVQALLILASALLVTLIFQRYTQRGLDRRIRESMDTLAYLAGRRRRRGRAAGGLPGGESEEGPVSRREK